MRTPVTVGVAGLGECGRRLARTLDDLPSADLRWLCDPTADVALHLRPRHSGVRWTPSFDDLLADDALDAVVVATPSATHAELVEKALRADKHVLVEKPLAMCLADAERLAKLAASRDRCLEVGGSFLFHPAFRKLRELLHEGALGELLYVYANRQDLGKVEREEDVVWSLGAAEVGTVLHLLEDEPIEVSARGDSYVREGIADVVFCYLKFATGIAAHLHLSWLDPQKLRKLTAVGSRRMAVIDHSEPDRKLTVYEKSVTAHSSDAFGEDVDVMLGEIVSPRLPNEQPLRSECEHFVTSIRSYGDQSMAHSGVATVAVLEALQRSLDAGGVPIQLAPNVPAPSVRRDAPLASVPALKPVASRG